MVRRILLGLVLVTAVATAAPAQIAPDPVSDNAAARYIYWGRKIPAEVVARLNQIEATVPKFRAVKQGNKPACTPTQIREALEKSQSVVGELIAAGALERCSFDFKPNTIGPEAKPATEIGRQMLAAGKLLHADACRAWQDGDMQGAADRVSALIGMARHMMHGTAHDSLSVMQGAATLELALKAVEEFDKAGQPFEGPLRAQVLQALKLFPAEDSFGLRAAWHSAWRESAARLKKQLAADEIDRAVIAAVWDVRARSIRTETKLGLPRTRGKVAPTPPEFDVEFYLKGHRLGEQAADEIERVWSDDAPHPDLENLLTRVNEEPTGFAVGVVGLFYDAYERNMKLARRVREFVAPGR